MKQILLWFEAPLQSWGSNSKFYNRGTMPFPTKSGVLGLTCCALGRFGQQTEFLAKFAKLKQTAVSYDRFVQKDGIDTIVKSQTLFDFHMIGSGYSEKSPIETLHIPKTSFGKNASNGVGVKITNRAYLQDACFAVILEVADDVFEEVKEGLSNPLYSISLGRKCCIPTEFVYQGAFDDYESAFAHANKFALKKHRIPSFIVYDGNKENSETMLLNDVPLQFGDVKKYQYRTVSVVDLLEQKL